MSKLNDVLSLSLRDSNQFIHSFGMGKRIITLALCVVTRTNGLGSKQYISIGRAIKSPDDSDDNDQGKVIAIGRAKKEGSELVSFEAQKMLITFGNRHIFNAMLLQLEKEHRTNPDKWLVKHIAKEAPKIRKKAVA